MKTKIIWIDPKSLNLLKTNAHFMRHETFMQLVSNLKEDSELTQLPFCAILDYYTADDPIPTDEKGKTIYEVISGNHRVKASIAAGIKKIQVQVTDEPLSPDKRKAIQLSHNSIFGEDDPSVLKMIYESIEDVGMRVYSGLDDKKLELLDQVKPGSLNEANLDFQTVSMVFLPDEKEKVLEVYELAKKAIAGSKGTWLARWHDYDTVMDALELAGRADGVLNVATALMVILEIFTAHKADLKHGFLDQNDEPVKGVNGHVPLEPILGEMFAPPKTASNLAKAITKARSQGKAKTIWDALDTVTDYYNNNLNNKG